MDSITGAEYLAICIAIGIAFVGAFSIAKFARTKQQREVEVETAKSQREALRRAIAAGTHDDQGFPLCRICGDKSKPESRATKHGFQIDRSERFLSWLRQMIGAPARLSVGRRFFDDHLYCRECAVVAEHELRAYLLAFEQQRRDQIRDAEVELRRFERAGLDERVRARVDMHEREQKKIANRPPATVIPFKASGS